MTPYAALSKPPHDDSLPRQFERLSPRTAGRAHCRNLPAGGRGGSGREADERFTGGFEAIRRRVSRRLELEDLLFRTREGQLDASVGPAIAGSSRARRFL